MAVLAPEPPAAQIRLRWGGKLPSVGDFVWSGTEAAGRVRLDDWLIAGMRQFRLTHGDSWNRSFDQAPLWNFAIDAGQTGGECLAGCLSPSCDRIGRRFPFVVAYGLSSSAPAWYWTQAVQALPRLLSRTGALLFDSIRRQWPRETLVGLLEQSLAEWQDALPVQLGAAQGGVRGDSVIMDVLFGAPGGDDEIPTAANDRASSFPWGNMSEQLRCGSGTSFWWTNGAGQAELKAFAYDAPLDGNLVAWLFG